MKEALIHRWLLSSRTNEHPHLPSEGAFILHLRRWTATRRHVRQRGVQRSLELPIGDAVTLVTPFPALIYEQLFDVVLVCSHLIVFTRVVLEIGVTASPETALLPRRLAS